VIRNLSGLTVATVKTLIASTVAASSIAIGLTSLAPAVSAQPLCEHRSAAHAAQSHTTREGDSRWHVAHGQLPTCNLDKSDDSDDNHKSDDNDTNHIPRRDHGGFHCTWHGCG
jgi:hypothetical protein